MLLSTASKAFRQALPMAGRVGTGPRHEPHAGVESGILRRNRGDAARRNAVSIPLAAKPFRLAGTRKNMRLMLLYRVPTPSMMQIDAPG